MGYVHFCHFFDFFLKLVPIRTTPKHEYIYIYYIYDGNYYIMHILLISDKYKYINSYMGSDYFLYFSAYKIYFLMIIHI